MSAKTSMSWRKEHPEEYRAYQRWWYHEVYRKRHPPKEKAISIVPIPKPIELRRKSASAKEIQEIIYASMEWNPRICEHGPHYDGPWVNDARRNLVDTQ
jgi:hypothetical protein